MAPRKKRDERELNGFFFAVNGARDGALQLRDELRGSCRHWLKTPDNPVTKDLLQTSCQQKKAALRFRLMESSDSSSGPPVLYGRLAQRLERSPHTREV